MSAPSPTAAALANTLRTTLTGGNWSGVSLRQALEGVSFEQATAKMGDLNTIEALVFHMMYYLRAQLDVFEGRPLNAHDSRSFVRPVLTDTVAWETQKRTAYVDAERWATYVERFTDEQLSDWFEQQKYGTYTSNLAGAIEHFHYHLGQVVLLKKLLVGKV